MAAHNELGHWGENIATEYLLRKGYRIIARDWKDGRRDIDIVAINDEYLIFVEVKTRRNEVFIQPEEAVDRNKVRSLCIAAAKFVKIHHINMALRFDVITVVGMPGDDYEINHIKDAFLPSVF